MQAHRRPSGADPHEAITILRVKRKRDQEPLDALVVQQQQQQQQMRPFARQKTTHTDALLFALGETISESDFSDLAKRQALQDRLTQLSSNHPTEVEMEDTEQAPRPLDPPSAQFRVLSKKRVQLAPRGIPQVLSAADLARSRQEITMFDAVNEEEYVHPHRTTDDPYAELALGSPRQGAVDDLVPMVRDYLTLSHGPPEYVYDFYYARQLQSADAQLSMGAVTWMDDADDLDDSSSEDADDDEDSNSEGYYANDYPDDESLNSADEYYVDDDDAVDICNMDGGGTYQDDDDYD
ncbi:hypothetical protein GGI24_002407 [Coemansia furcata]|nr:hypothetical protein GGI24_002407 [Coemansia furcata]